MLFYCALFCNAPLLRCLLHGAVHVLRFGEGLSRRVLECEIERELPDVLRREPEGLQRVAVHAEPAIALSAGGDGEAAERVRVLPVAADVLQRELHVGVGGVFAPEHRDAAAVFVRAGVSDRDGEAVLIDQRLLRFKRHAHGLIRVGVELQRHDAVHRLGIVLGEGADRDAGAVHPVDGVAREGGLVDREVHIARLAPLDDLEQAERLAEEVEAVEALRLDEERQRRVGAVFERDGEVIARVIFLGRGEQDAAEVVFRRGGLGRGRFGRGRRALGRSVGGEAARRERERHHEREQQRDVSSHVRHSPLIGSHQVKPKARHWARPSPFVRPLASATPLPMSQYSAACIPRRLSSGLKRFLAAIADVTA